MIGIIVAVFDWKERDDARKWVRRMKRRGLYTYMAETGHDSYNLIALIHPNNLEDFTWWRDSLQNMFSASIRPVTERLDE
jgi:hypothetical protein